MVPAQRGLIMEGGLRWVWLTKSEVGKMSPTWSCWAFPMISQPVAASILSQAHSLSHKTSAGLHAVKKFNPIQSRSKVENDSWEIQIEKKQIRKVGWQIVAASSLSHAHSLSHKMIQPTRVQKHGSNNKNLVLIKIFIYGTCNMEGLFLSTMGMCFSSPSNTSLFTNRGNHLNI